MPGHTCFVCDSTSRHDPDAYFHRFPSDPDRKASWLTAFSIDETQLKAQSRVCSRHFRDGNAKNEPLSSLGKRFASPIKSKHPRAKRAKTREGARHVLDLRASLSRSVTPSTESTEDPAQTSQVSPSWLTGASLSRTF